MINKTQLWIPLMATALLLHACGGASRKNDPVTVTQDTLDVAIEESVDNALLIAVSQFQTDVDTLNDSANRFCTAPEANTLETLQENWKKANVSWFRLALYNYGPLNDDVVFPPYSFIDSLRIRGTNYTATDRTEISNWVAAETPLDDAFFAEQTFQKVGLLAVEIAAFETVADQSQEADDIVNEFITQPRKCDVLKGLSNQLLIRAEYVHNDWTVQHKNADHPYRELFLNNELDDGAEPLTKLLTGAQEFLDYLKQRHVVTTAAQLSNHAWESIDASLDEVERLLNGTDTTTVSFFSLMESAGYNAAIDTVESNLAMARASILNRDATELEVALALLDGNFKREIPNGLEVELGINFTDGD